MRILFFINGIYLGGKERRMIELMKELNKKSNIIFELAVMNKEINYPDILDMGVKIHFLIRNTKKDISIFKKIYSVSKEFKPDIIHCWDSMTAVYSIPACRFLKIGLINGMIVDAPSKTNLLNKNWLRARLTFPFSNVIISNSRAGLKAYKAPKNKSQYIYNGFNFSRIAKLEDKEKLLTQLNIRSEFIVGMVATFSDFKDYKTYYRAAEIILQKRADVTFLAIGNNTDSDASRNLIQKNLIGHFRFLGKQNNIESLINLMDVCVLSTFTEGISNAILEYMSLSKPVIATEGGGTSEIISDQSTGYLIKKSNPIELAEKLELLLDYPELRTQMGLSGKKLIEERFSMDSMVDRYLSVYQNISVANDLKKKVSNN